MTTSQWRKAHPISVNIDLHYNRGSHMTVPYIAGKGEALALQWYFILTRASSLIYAAAIQIVHTVPPNGEIFWSILFFHHYIHKKPLKKFGAFIRPVTIPWKIVANLLDYN